MTEVHAELDRGVSHAPFGQNVFDEDHSRRFTVRDQVLDQQVIEPALAGVGGQLGQVLAEVRPALGAAGRVGGVGDGQAADVTADRGGTQLGGEVDGLAVPAAR